MRYLYTPYRHRIDNPQRPVVRPTLDRMHHPREKRGALLYYNGYEYVVIAPGSAGQVLVMVNGLPAWADLSSIVDYGEDGDIQSVGVANDSGTSDEVARADHVHEGAADAGITAFRDYIPFGTGVAVSP